MKDKDREMFSYLIKGSIASLLLTATIVAFILFALDRFLNFDFQANSAALIMGIIGTTLAFVGTSFVSDALGRYGGHGLPQYKWGNRIQATGFALTIVALVIK